MKRISYRSYLFFALFIFLCLNLPSFVIAPLQSRIVSLTHPIWQNLAIMRQSILPSKGKVQMTVHQLEEKLEKEEGEKRQLLRQNEELKRRLQLAEEMRLATEKKGSGASSEFQVRRQKHLERRLELESKSILGKVIFREPSSWSSFVWIDVGEEDNRALGFPLISHNSVVLSGDALIGLIEYVGKKQSRVRLITDSSLAVSVRATRGKGKNQQLLANLNKLLLELSLSEENEPLIAELERFTQKLQQENENYYLAKGEVFGTSSPLWRSRSPTLKGVGFNYDFDDEEGAARELRSGKLYHRLFHDKGAVLIQEGDLLLTSGLDGIFPADLPVAYVSKVKSLQEGEVSYSIEAKLCNQAIGELSTVVVLPSLEVMKGEFL